MKVNVGGYQNWGLFLGTLNNRCRITLMSQKGTLILTTTHVYPSDLIMAAAEFLGVPCRLRNQT